MLSLSRKRRLRENQQREAENRNEGSDENKRLRREPGLSLTQSQLITSDRCGKIIRIHLQNFMCHGNLLIEFHDRINFLVGSNGSGKSAIMAALVLGLGSKARATNRSGSMKQFIKTGERSAKIEITFSNAGSQGYEPEVYGDSITVVRNLLASGGSNVVVKNHYGHIISKKMDDLGRILLYHNMQVDNPVFVLNQDSARDFLKELDPRKNFQMFLKATQMEMIAEKHHECLRTLREHFLNIKYMKKKIIKAEEEVQQMMGKLDILTNLESVKNKIKMLKLELAWCKVNQHENEMKDLLQALEHLEKEQTEIQQGSRSKNALETGIRDQISELERNVMAKRNDLDAENAKLKEIKEKIDNANQNSIELSSTINHLKKKKSTIELNIIELQNHIQQQENSDVETMRKNNNLILNKHRKDLEELNNMLLSTKRDMKMFIDSREEKREQERQLKDQRNHLNTNLARIRSRISSINPNAKDKLSPFGNEIMQLVAEIEKFHRREQFTRKPLGPLGSYIEVPNSKYRDVIEGQLGNLVKAFIVHNAKDRSALQAIIRRLCPHMRFIIITMKFKDKVYDVRKGLVKPPHGTRLLMNEIKCSDSNVMNCLIDRLRIESVLLTDDVKTSEQITSQLENVPVNMTKVIVPQHHLEYYPEPKYRIYSLTKRPAQYIQVDARQQIATLERDGENLGREILKIERELQTLTPKIAEDAVLVDEKRQTLYQQETKQNELKLAIDAIQNIVYPEPIEMELLKRELCTYNSKISDIDSKIKEKKRDLCDINEEKENYQQTFMQYTGNLDGIQKEIDVFKQPKIALGQQLQEMNTPKSSKTSVNRSNKRFITDVLPDSPNATPTNANNLNEMAYSELLTSINAMLDDKLKFLENKADRNSGEILQKLDDMSNSISELKQQNMALKQEIELLKIEKDADRKRITLLESQLKRRNLIFKGLNPNNAPVTEIKNICREKLQLTSNITIQSARKLYARNGKMAVVAEFESRDNVVMILKNSAKLAGSNIYIENDLNADRIEKKKVLMKLRENLKSLEEHHKITVRDDRLKIGDKWLYWSKEYKLMCENDSAFGVLKMLYKRSYQKIDMDYRNLLELTKN